MDFRNMFPQDIILVTDLLISDTLYAYSGTSIHKSSDGGTTWQLMADDEIPNIPPSVLNRFLQDEPVSYIRQLLDPRRETAMLTIDPVNPAHWYAVSNNGSFLLESIDAGNSWNQISVLLSPAYEGSGFLAVDPSNPAALFVASWGGVYRSIDGGLNWVEAIADPGPSGHDFHTLLFDPAFPDMLYAVDSIHTLYKSMDGGDSWIWIYGENIPYITGWLALDPLDSNILYGLDASGIAQLSTDGGQTWTASDLGLPSTVLAFAIDPLNSSVRYAILETGEISGLFKSVDGGNAWDEVPATLLP
jgi:photosystem II stability/assembly factor-like uncharacterized protein